MSLKDPWDDPGLPPVAPPEPGQGDWPPTPRRRFRHRRPILMIGGGILAFIVLSEVFNMVQRTINPQERLVRQGIEQGAKQVPELLPDAQNSSPPVQSSAAPSLIASSTATPLTGSMSPADRPGDLPQFITSLLESVVAVECNVETNTSSYGSGFAFDTTGLDANGGKVIVTNWHVLDECPEGSPIYVTTARGEQAAATVIDSDPAADLALLTESGLNLPALQPASTFNQGDWVMAAGNPEGVTGTTTSGSIANIKPEDEEVFSDSVIAPGSSGGPLVNNRGEVIGVTMAIFTSSTGFSISRPVSSLCNNILACP